MSKVISMTEDDCKQWQQNPTVNPTTRRQIKMDGPVFKQIAKACDQYGIRIGANDPVPTTKTTAAKPDMTLQKAIKSKEFDTFKQFIEDSSNQISLDGVIPQLKHKYIWISLAMDEFKVTAGHNVKLFQYIHEHLVGKLGGEDKVIELYKNSYNHSKKSLVSTLSDMSVAMRKAFYAIWPVSDLATTTVDNNGRKDNVLLYEMIHRERETIQDFVKRKVPFANSTLNTALLWAGHLGQTDIFELLVNAYKVNPNAQDSSEYRTPLAYYLARQHTASKDVKQYIDAGASIYALMYNPNVARETTLWSKSPTMIPDVKSVLSAIIKNDINRVINGEVQISSDAVIATMIEFERVHPVMMEQMYMYAGVPMQYQRVLKSLIEEKKHPHAMFMRPKSYWISDDVKKALVVKCVKIGETKDLAYPIYEIQLHHKNYQKPVGIIGNFVPRLSQGVASVAAGLANPSLIEKALNKIHSKGKLLLKTAFPYRSVVDIHVFDTVDMDRLKLNNGKASPYFSNKIHSRAFQDMLISINSVLGKERYIPTQVLGKVKKPFSSTFGQVMKDHEDLVAKSKRMMTVLAKSRSSSKTKSKSSKSPKVDIRSLLEDHPRAKDISEKLKATKGPIYDVKEITSDDSFKDVMETAAKRKAALKTIASHAKRRVSKLTKYYEDSMQYIDSLPKKLRQQLYRAVNGHIMQGPYSPIRRYPGGLLYAKSANAEDVRSMIEVTMRAPRFPMRYTLYRGMALPEVPKPNHTVVYQELPFSTTFISNYAIGWILAKKRAGCCLLEVLCHAGTGGLYLSKLPWMDPWTSMNSAIFQRIAPENASARFHVKVNSQNEFLMQPYRLKVVGQRKKNFKNMLKEQLEKLDSHYEFDAAQRGLTSLQTNNPDLLDQEIDVYQVVLEPISVKYVLIPSHVATDFNPTKLYTKTVDKLDNFYLYTKIFFSPEELQDTEPHTYKLLMEAIDKNKLQVETLIDKGKYVGAKTF